MQSTHTARPLAILILLLASCPSQAHEGHAEDLLEELVVYGRAEQAVGVALSASQGMLGYDDIRLPPLLRVGELVEGVPGMVATQHSGTGKANQYYLRGFNLDHGTDFSATAEGVPLNMRSHGHGQGYLDLNFLIPEMVATTRYRKGPYWAESGDFSSAGSVAFQFYDRLDDSIAELTLGEDGYRRVLMAGSLALNDADEVVTAAWDSTRNEGPWDLDENLNQHKLLLSYRRPVGRAQAKFTLQGYRSRWQATDQVPLRAVRTGQIGTFGYIDPDLGGETTRLALTGALDFEAWRVNAYALHYDFSLFSNFTYLLDDPVVGDEFEQRDRRWVYGLRLDGDTAAEFADRPVRLNWGADLRFDRIGAVGLYRTAARTRLATVRDDRVDEASLGTYLQAEWAASERLRVALGLRGDTYAWQVDASQAPNSGSGRDALISPKLALAYRVAPGAELYFNAGQGMHSNDVRGATIRVDPVNGDPVARVDALVPSTGAEVGMRFEAAEVFNATLAWFWLELDSELVFVGDAGGTEAAGRSRREGVETNLFWQINRWLAANAAYTRAWARLVDEPGTADHVPGAIESSYSLGLNGAWSNGLSASLRVRHLGEAALVEDNGVRSDSSRVVNAALAYRRGSLEWRLEAFNVLDSNDHDVTYYYASRLPTDGAQGVDDLHFHPLEPRTLRASLKVYW